MPPFKPSLSQGSSFSGGIPDSEFNRYVNALSQQPFVSQTGSSFGTNVRPQAPIQGQMLSSTIGPQDYARRINQRGRQKPDMGGEAYKRYLGYMDQLRTAEQQPRGRGGPPRAPAGSGSEFDRYGGYVDPAISELSSAPPELSAAPAAEAQNMKAQNKLIYRLLSAEKPPATGPLGDFFESMGNKVR